MLRRKIVIRITEQGLRGSHQFRVRITFAERRASRRRSHCVNIGIIKKSRVGMMIEDWNLFKLRKQALIYLLYVWAGQRTSLSEGWDCSA
jgi:hypothetical protein